MILFNNSLHADLKKIDDNEEEYIKKDLPESAAKEINHIWDMAAKDNDGRHMLKSAVYLTQVQQTYGENSISEGIELFNTLLPTLRVTEHKALCHAFLAKGYMAYWNRYGHVSRNNIPSDEENAPVEHWTAKMICDTICYHLDQSIKLAGDVGSGFYQEFFPGGNKAGQKLRPLLVDMLMDNALVLITDYRLPLGKRSFLDDSRLYGSMSDFLEAYRILELPADAALPQAAIGVTRNRDGVSVLLKAEDAAGLPARPAALEEIMIHLEKEAEEA